MQPHSQVGAIFIGKNHWLIKGLTAKLRQRHARKHQSVLYLGKGNIGFVDFNIYTEQGGSGCHTLLKHLLHIIVEVGDKFQITLSEFFLGTQRNHEPIGLVNAVNHILGFAVMKQFGNFFGIFGNLIHSLDFSSHVDWLGNKHSSRKHIVSIKRQRILNLLGSGIYHLTVERQANTQIWVDNKVEIACSRVEQLRGSNVVDIDK